MITVHQVNNTDRTNANGQVVALTDRRWYEFLIHQTGIGSGCQVTAVSGLQIHVAAGWGIIKGCLFTISEETITVTASSSGTVNGRLLLQLDVATGTGSFITQAAATLPALIREDINTNGTIYQIVLATYQVSDTAVSGLQSVGYPIAELIDSTELAAALSQKQDYITGAASSIVSNNLTPTMVAITDPNGKIAASSGITVTELSYLNNVTSNIQTQLNGKQATISGAASTVASSNLTTNRALVSNGSGKIAASSVTATELGYLSGLSQSITSLFDVVDAQLNGKLVSFGGSATSVTAGLDDIWSRYGGNGIFASEFTVISGGSSTYYLALIRKISSTTGIAVLFPVSLTNSKATIDFWRRTNSTWTKFTFTSD